MTEPRSTLTRRRVRDGGLGAPGRRVRAVLRADHVATRPPAARRRRGRPRRPRAGRRHRARARGRRGRRTGAPWSASTSPSACWRSRAACIPTSTSVTATPVAAVRRRVVRRGRGELPDAARRPSGARGRRVRARPAPGRAARPDGLGRSRAARFLGVLVDAVAEAERSRPRTSLPARPSSGSPTSASSPACSARRGSRTSRSRP